MYFFYFSHQDATVKHYLMKGADAEKLVLGIPTYGRSYTLFNADSTELGSPADGPGEQGDATREKGYLAYYEVSCYIRFHSQIHKNTIIFLCLQYGNDKDIYKPLMLFLNL